LFYFSFKLRKKNCFYFFLIKSFFFLYFLKININQCFFLNIKHWLFPYSTEYIIVPKNTLIYLVYTLLGRNVYRGKYVFLVYNWDNTFQTKQLRQTVSTEREQSNTALITAPLDFSQVTINLEEYPLGPQICMSFMNLNPYFFTKTYRVTTH